MNNAIPSWVGRVGRTCWCSPSVPVLGILVTKRVSSCTSFSAMLIGPSYIFIETCSCCVQLLKFNVHSGLDTSFVKSVCIVFCNGQVSCDWNQEISFTKGSKSGTESCWPSGPCSYYSTMSLLLSQNGLRSNLRASKFPWGACTQTPLVLYHYACIHTHKISM